MCIVIIISILLSISYLNKYCSHILKCIKIYFEICRVKVKCLKSKIHSTSKLNTYTELQNRIDYCNSLVPIIGVAFFRTVHIK